MTKFCKEDTTMSIRPEKLKQYISLKEAALTLRPDFAVDCNDPKPESKTATVSVVLHTPFICLDRTKTAIASLFTFCDTFIVADSDVIPNIVRFTFGVDGMQKEE